MILDLVRSKVICARSKIVSIVTTTLISGLLVSIPVPANAAACNPTSTTVSGDTVLTFTDVGSCDWTVPEGVSTVRALVVAGGGAGGGGWTTKYFGNGGGGGEVKDSSITVTPQATINVTVGAGGQATNYDTNSTSLNDGSASVFGTVTSRGGSSTRDRTTRVGGSSGNLNTGGTGVNTATEGGGGAGAGGNGSTRNGGAGVTSNITGTSLSYGGGGGSMGFGASGPEYGSASGGGGVTPTYNTNAKGNGAANTGGGGAGDNGVAGGGAGGSGVVVVRYSAPTNCSYSTATVGADTVLTFTTTGSCSWTVPTGVTSVRVLVVGGGSSGGAGLSGVYWPQGGGGGAVVHQTNVATEPGQALSVTVGGGGAALTTVSSASTSINNGGQSSFASLIAPGGIAPATHGGNGGRSGNGNAGGTTIGGFSAGGGGGAGGVGSGLTGGVGINSDITGSILMYGSGGAGANGSTGSAYSGGGSNDNPPTANRGGGGSQPTANSGLGSAGAAGVVIVRYKALTTCSPTSVTIDSEISLIFTSTTPCVWSVPSGVRAAKVLVVAGGGGGGYYGAGGGGGAGGVLTNSNFSLTTNSVLTIAVGDGGAGATTNTPGGNGSSGSNSSITMSGNSFVAVGGGFGAGGQDITAARNAGNGGSGGGGNGGGTACQASSQTASSSTKNSYVGWNSYGFGGGKGCTSGTLNAGGGGGGATGPGTNGDGATGTAGVGGPGLVSDISGSAITYAIGGSAGGLGTTLTANRGHGGGPGGPGSSGVVVIRYSTVPTSIITFNSNGGTGSVSGVVAATGSAATLPDQTGLSRSGFDFVGWNTQADGNGTNYLANASFTVSADVTLYAKWRTIPGATCAVGVGVGGIKSSVLANTKAGNGCVVIRFVSNRTTSTTTFNYTGSDQSWTVPSGVTNATFYLIGAGGGGGISFAGGGAGYATGSYAVTPGAVLKIIVGEGGGGAGIAAVSGLPGSYTPLTYGGGGRAGSFVSGWLGYYSSGGGRSAIRLPGATTDLVTAGGGGGAAYGECGFGGGGTVGNGGVRGGTQSAGGTGGASANGYPGTAGVAYLGGLSKDEGGGGGGGFFGGGGGGDNTGGGGGSSYIALLTGGITTAGGNCGAAATSTGLGNTISYNANNATSGVVPNSSVAPLTGSATLATNTGTLARTNFTLAGWNTQADGKGTAYKLGDTTYTGSGDVTLYAQWNSTITYNANGATSGTAPAATIAKGDSAGTLLATQGSLLRTNFKFVGWNTLADGTGTLYAAGATNYASTGNVTLYAQWTASTAAPTLDSGSDTGNSSTDKLTKDNTPTINVGSLTTGASVTITATSTTGATTTCTFTATGTTGSCTFSTLVDGTYSFTVTQTYNGGTSSASTALTGVVIDTVAPTVTLSSANVVSGGNLTATVATPNVSATVTITFSKSVTGLLISEVIKNAESTGWAITTASFTTAAITSINFAAANSTGAGGVAGTARFSIPANAAFDAAGNGNSATSSDFVINTLIQIHLSNQYHQTPLLSPVVGGNNAYITQTTPGETFTLPGAGTLTRAGHTFAGWSLSTTDGTNYGSGVVVGTTYTPTVPVKFYSSWTPNVYVVTYNANGGNGAPTDATESYTYGSTALTLSTKGTLTRTGYTFAGWNTLATGLGTNYLENANYTPTASITLYAKWTAGTYAVSFNANTGTGTTITNLSITAGTAKTLTANTYTKVGYTFAGWNTAADGSGNSYANSASVTLYGDTTLYAQWIVVAPGAPSVTATSAGNTTVNVTITGVAASGTTVGPATSFSVQTYLSDGTTVVTGKTCTLLASASPLSCEITGLTNGTTYKFKATAINTTASATGAISSVTAIPAPYVVTYAINGGTLGTTTANYNLGTPVILPLPTKTGNTFAGWNNPSNTSVGIDGSSYSPTASITLTAQWTPSTYTITYNGNGSDGGSVPGVGSFTYGNNYSIASKGTMTKSGYAFAGWTASANGSGTLYANATDSIATSTATYSTASNLTVYAKWTPQVFVITYDVNGASGSPSRATDSYTFGTTAITLPTSNGMTYPNYTFGGWSETSTGVAVVDPYSPTQTRTLYAIWTGIQYSITYSANGGTVNTAIPDATYTTGTAGITLNNGSTLSRTGYTFGGWKDAAGTTVSGSPYVATSNVTLYAIWTPKSIAVTYDKGIASAIPATFPTTPTTATFGSNFTLGSSSDTTTVTSGGSYKFAGWKIGNDIYKPGDSYRITSEIPVSITAQWIQLFEVTYNANGGAFANGEGINDSECGASKLCSVNAPITLNATPTRTGFTFAGWVSQSGVSYLQAAVTTVTETNYIFYATWTASSYTITFAAGLGSNGNAAAITDSHGAVVQLPSNTGYSLTGSIFTGWLIGSTTYAAGALYTMGTDASPITATAQYANNTFKIFYNTNGATDGSTPAATTAAQGATINLDAATGFSRAGYTFEGWSDGTNLRAASYSTTMGSTNSTYIAQWKIAAPVAPTVSSVTGTDGGATIAVAAGTGGGAPASYLVTASPGGATCTVYTPSTSCSISPLTNGTTYTFAVTATNSTGTSSSTTSSSVTPAGTPSAPTGVNAVRGNTTATVSLNAVTGSNTGGPAITSYTITAYDSSNNAVGTPCTATGGATSCVVTGLTNGTAYTFKATASNGLFTSAASTASAAVIPATVPDTPTSVAATVTASGQATISFTAPTNNGGAAITGYTITSSPGGFTCTAAPGATSCVVSGLTNGTAYTFTALATNEIGNSVASTVTSSVTPQGAASAPTTVSAAVGDGQSVVTFSGAVANGSTITNYTVKAYDSTGNVVATVTCSTSPCTVTGLTNGSAYTFKVETNSTVYGTATTSAPSVATSAITPAAAPSAPTGVTATAGTNKVIVEWDEPASNGSPITSYLVQAYDSAGNPVSGATCTATAPSTTCDVSANLLAGSNYTFKVTATSSAGTSTTSTASPSASMNSAPSAPLSVIAVSGVSSATVSWDSPANTNGSAITSYTVTAYTAGNVIAGTCTVTAPAQSCTVSGLTNGTPYTFKVTATNGIGTSTQSTASSPVTPSTVPNPPTGLTVASGDGSVTVSFAAPANNGGSTITGYILTASNGSTISGSSSPLTISGLTNGTAYTFTVKASNINGDSVASATSAASTPVASSAPTLANPGQPTGNPYVGSTLTSNVTFNGSPTPTITYQWKVCTDPLDLSTCTNISGATSSTFTPTISELGKYIVVAATATNRVDTLTETSIPTLVINPEIDLVAPSPIPGATAGTAYVLSLAAAGGVGAFGYTVSNGTLPAGLTLDPSTGQIAGTPTTAGTYTFTVRATDANGVFKDVVVTIIVAAATITPTPTPTPTPSAPVATCDSACQASRDAAAADRAAADALAKAAAEKAAADATAAAKASSDAAATAASTKAAADAAAAAAAAKAAVEKAAAAEAAKIAADAAAAAAAAKAKAAADAQAAANKAAATAAAALKNSAATAAAKAAATASAQKAAADAAAAVKAAATAAQQAASAKNTAANANKQVDIAINSLSSKTAASQASAQANAIAAAAKAAANEAAAAAAAKAAEAKATATAAQRAAADTAARIAIEQKEAATAAAIAKAAADAAAKASAEKIAAANAAKSASEALLKVLQEKATLAEQAAKTSDESVRAEITKKLETLEVKADEAEKLAEEATADAEEAVAQYEEAVDQAAEASKVAETQASEAVAVKAESVTKTAAATKAVAAATVATKVAAAAKAAAAKVPSKAVIATKPSTSTKKNSATATVTGLKPGQKVKVTVNVKPKP